MKGIVVDIAINVTRNVKNIEVNVEAQTLKSYTLKMDGNGSPRRLVLPKDTQVVTIKIICTGRCCTISYGKCIGILASFSNGIVTDRSWSCFVLSRTSSYCHRGSKEIASVACNNEDSNPPEIASNAQWIWISPSSSAKSIYCEKILGKFN